VQTGDSGEYTAPSLPPGVYSVVVDAKGFGKQTTNNITLVVAQQSRVNSTLQPGTLDQTVEVSAGAVTLDTDSSAVTQLVSERQVNQLPLNGRNFLSLLFIGAGAVQTVGEQGQMRQGEGNAISINGSRPESNNYTLDGMVNIDTALNTPAVILSQDAIQEFKVQNATYGAEYGFSANQVNIVSKSSELHNIWLPRQLSPQHVTSQHYRPADLQAGSNAWALRFSLRSLYQGGLCSQHCRSHLASLRTQHLYRELNQLGDRAHDLAWKQER